ncbi:hypothetical protein N7497_004358 [Penicillium chrysogenum]|nr:hypothetical protein N7497_004358 [Penicillium chrysogenum]
MTYILFYFLLFSVIIGGTALYLTRSRWMPLVQVPDYLYHRLPSSFTADLEAGLSSSQFDITANLADGDSKGWLGSTSKDRSDQDYEEPKGQF